MANELTFSTGVGSNVVGLDKIPEEFRARAQSIVQKVESKLTRKINTAMAAAYKRIEDAEEKRESRAGEWVDPFIGYEAWDIGVYAPFQLDGPPIAYAPSKIIGSGETVLFIAVLFINPLPYGMGPPVTTHLAGEEVRVRFENINLTDVTDGPDHTVQWTLGAPAPFLTFIPWLHTPTVTGPNPLSMELNVTADITEAAAPYAAFANQWMDFETDPGWPLPGLLPEVPGGLKQQIPLRYLVYPK